MILITPQPKLTEASQPGTQIPSSSANPFLVDYPSKPPRNSAEQQPAQSTSARVSGNSARTPENTEDVRQKRKRTSKEKQVSYVLFWLLKSKLILDDFCLDGPRLG